MKKLFTLAFALVFSTGIAFAQNNDSDVSQSGGDNEATIQQVGSNNESDLSQSNFSNGSFLGHEAGIYQDGADNVADVLSDGGTGTNVVDLDQLGTSNDATIAQKWGQNTAEVLQDGMDNEANVQHRGSYQSSADVDQIGAYNFAEILDIGQTGSNPNTLNEASIMQKGNDNIAGILQEGDGNKAASTIGPYDSHRNSTNIHQDGNGNDASFTMQAGDDNVVKIDQVGDQNDSEYFVKYGDANDIDVTVEGTSNRTRLSIDASWGSRSSNNTITVEKDGNTNYLSGSIEGYGNMVDVSQIGNDNRVGTSWYTKDGVAIAGDGNTVDVTQNGSGHMSTTMINGNNNTATVMQSN